MRKRPKDRGKREDRFAGTIASLGRWKLNKIKPHWCRQDERTEGRGKIAFGFEDRRNGKTSNPLHGAN
jgi:hypothetical protein